MAPQRFHTCRRKAPVHEFISHVSKLLLTQRWIKSYRLVPVILTIILWPLAPAGLISFQCLCLVLLLGGLKSDFNLSGQVFTSKCPVRRLTRIQYHKGVTAIKESGHILFCLVECDITTLNNSQPNTAINVFNNDCLLLWSRVY